MLVLTGQTSKIGFTVDGEGKRGVWGNASASLSFIGHSAEVPDVLASWSIEQHSDDGDPPAHLRHSLSIPGVKEALARSPDKDLIVLWPLERTSHHGADAPTVAVFCICSTRKFTALCEILERAQAFRDMSYTISALAFFELIDRERTDAVHLLEFDNWVRRSECVFASADLDLTTSTRRDPDRVDASDSQLVGIRRWIMAAVAVGAISTVLQCAGRW